MASTMPTQRTMSHLSSSFRSLPPELVDLIISQTHDRVLFAICSLVCKAWLPAARRQLFSTTILNVNNVSAFFDLIVSTSASTVAPFIRQIDAKDNCESSRWLDDHSIILQPNLLPSLTSISIITPDYISYNTLSALRSLDRLTELRLAECQFQEFSQVQTLLCAFPALENLYLEANWPEPHVITPTETSPSSHLRKLHLRCEISHMLEWFLRQTVVAPISELTLHSMEVNELPIISLYVRTLGSALTHLTILPSGALHDSLPKHLNLSSNPCLRFLKLAIDCDANNLHMIHTLLSHVESPIEEVELSFYTVRQRNDIDRHWADLDALLTAPRFASMTRMSISSLFSSTLAKETLPMCDGRGILCIRRL